VQKAFDWPRHQGRNAMSAETTKPTLYDRLGGVYSIAAVVDDFIDRVMHNPVLNANPAVDRSSRLGYDTMAKFNVPEAERYELYAIVESTKSDIVCG
jgi:hypothetical protein